MINRSLKKPTIVATHMLESMIENPTPTRAEVTDIQKALMQVSKWKLIVNGRLR